MEEKKNSTFSEVIADIAVTPITIASMAVKAKRKIEETPTKTGTIGSDVKDAKEKASARVSEAAQRIQDADVGQRIKDRVQESEIRQKIKDKVDEINTPENAAKLQDVVDTAGNKVKNFAYQFHDDMTENVIKAKNGFDDFKAKVNDKNKPAKTTAAEAEAESEGKVSENKPKDATDILIESAKEIKNDN